MNPIEQKKAAKQFVENWKGRGQEKSDCQLFWIDLLHDVVGMQGLSGKVKFEYPAMNGGFIDALIPDSKVLIEQKSIGVDLDKREPRQGKDVTPFEQALAYAESFPPSMQPRFIIVSNFESFRVHDRESCSRSELPSKYTSFELEELAGNPHLLDFIIDPENSRSEREKQVSILAGEKIGQFYDMMRGQFIDPDSEESQHALNVLCVRLVFCLYCEDADLFPKDAFLNFLKNVEPANMRETLKRLFRALNTPIPERDPYDEKVKPFPYVNGGLFAEETEIPNFTQDIKFFMLFDLSQQIDWSDISPTVFGGIFESTLNPETRRSGGMHYTSPENIHKVIDPLFLDDLRREFDEIRLQEGQTPKKIKQQLRRFREKLGSLRFFDPACGSGNFLTETYLCLRQLEDVVLAVLNDGQTEIVFGEGESQESKDKRVTLDQFYGIEINGFACSVADVALWIAQLQTNNTSQMTLDVDIDDFPLVDRANIVCGNALRMDWNDVLPAGECDYVLGNPPFYGARMQSKEQKAELQEVFHNAKNSGNVDYVAGWYIKAAEYIDGLPIRCAFVSTNSICQGEQVANIWKPVYDLGVRIDFAHDTFRWRNEATDQAHVFVVIVGFSKLGGKKTLFHYENPDAGEEVSNPDNINAYLSTAPDVFVWNRSKPLCNVPAIGIGNKPIDGGNYLFKENEKEEFLKAEPGAAKYFHTWLGSDEFLNNRPRSVLWLGNATEEDLESLPMCRARIENVRQARLASSSAPTRKLAETPTRFHVENMPSGTSILVPKVSSERRHYIPLGFIGPETFCSDLVFLIPDATLWHFGVLHSQFHNAWMRVVAGRLKSDYRYSGGMVYNNFIWPDPTPEQREQIEACAQAVLDARDSHPGKSLADLYDPDKMPSDLLAAHKALDKAVEQAYGVDFDGDEEKIVAHLFKLYAEATKDE